MSTDLSPDPKVSAVFNDTSADTRLVSSDGVVFHVESVVFRDLLKSPARASDEPILLDAPEAADTLFLRLCMRQVFADD
ncbi:hypothetical protein Q5752_006556 [Cryptotrichosporon argae]